MAPNVLPKKGKKKDQQLLLMGGGAAVVVVIAALMHRQSAAQAAAGTTQAATGLQGSYDSTANDVYNSIEDQLGALQQQLAQITQGSAGSGGTPTGGAGSGGAGTGTPVPGQGGGGVSKPGSGSGGKPKIHGGNPPRRGPFSWVTVQRGQTLSGIASQHHETLGTLLADNPTYTRNPKYRGGNRIWAGDKVKVR